MSDITGVYIVTKLMYLKKAGQHFTILPLAVYTDGSVKLAAPGEAQYISSSPEVASFEDGRVQLLSKGSTILKAIFEGREDSLRLLVL